MCRRKEPGGAVEGSRGFTKVDLAGVVESACSRRKEEAVLVIAETGADFETGVSESEGGVSNLGVLGCVRDVGSDFRFQEGWPPFGLGRLNS